MSPHKKKKHDPAVSNSSEEQHIQSAEEMLTVENQFVCPEKFKNLEPTYDDLCLEDVKKDPNKELWLIRAPLEFDSSLLDGQQILTGAQFELDEDIKFEVFAKEEKQIANITAILPSKKKKRLFPGPAFKGLISIVTSVHVQSVVLPQSPPKMSFEIPTGLKQRFKPFGSGSPSKTWHDQELEAKRGATVAEEPVDAPVSSKKKKKAKKRGIKQEIRIKEEPKSDNQLSLCTTATVQIKQEVVTENENNTNTIDINEELDSGMETLMPHSRTKKKKKHKKH